MNDVKMFCDFLDRNKNIEPIQSYLTFIKDNYMIIPLQVQDGIHFGCFIFHKDIYNINNRHSVNFLVYSSKLANISFNETVGIQNKTNQFDFNDILTVIDKDKIGYGNFGIFNDKCNKFFYINFTTINDVIDCFKLFMNVYVCLNYNFSSLYKDKIYDETSGKNSETIKNNERIKIVYNEKINLFDKFPLKIVMRDYDRLFVDSNKKYDNVIQKMKEEYYNYLSEIKITKVMNEINRLKFMISKKDIIVKLTEFFENKEFITKDEFNKIKKDFE